MKISAIFFYICFNSALAIANPKAPIHGKFDYTKFLGMYRYQNCKVANSEPIWAENPETTTVEISNRNFIEPDFLEMVRWTENNNGILLGMSLEKINQGKQTEIDQDTHKLVHSSESYTTKDGVYNFLSWNVQDINVGWSSVQLKVDKSGNISYIMRIQRTDDAHMKEEICTLLKI